MPTHAHNKAPTADHWVAGGGFSLDDAQRETPSRGNTHYIYRAVRTLSAPLRPSAPGGRGLHRHPPFRRPPFGARPAPERQKTPPARRGTTDEEGTNRGGGERKRPPCLRSCPAAQRFAANEAPQSAHTVARSRIHPPQRRPTCVNLSTVAPKEKATQDAQGHPRQKREVENHKNSVLRWRKQSVSLPQRYAFFSTPSHPVPAFRSLCALPAPAPDQRFRLSPRLPPLPSAPPPVRAPPRPRSDGKFHINKEEMRRNARVFTFFYF